MLVQVGPSEMSAVFGESTTWVFFDLGNTLIDESVAITRRVEQIALEAAALGYTGLGPQELYRQIELASADHAVWPLSAALSAAGVLDSHAKQLAGTCRYEHSFERLFPDTIALLEQVSCRYRVGYVANQSPGLSDRLAVLGIARYFRTGSDSGASNYSKPDIRLYQEALEKAGTTASAALMVGDRVDNDVAPAKRLGMKTVRIRQGYSRLQEPRGPDENPDWTISSLAELLK